MSEYKEILPKAYIFDFDGVLSDNSEREYLLHQENKSQEECKLEFYAASEQDKPFENTVKLLKSLSLIGYKILIVTARYYEHDNLLINWLKKNDIERYVYKIFSVNWDTNTHELDWEKKYKIYANNIENTYDVQGVFEDNEDCVEIYAKAFGLTCYHVKRGVK